MKQLLFAFYIAILLPAMLLPNSTSASEKLWRGEIVNADGAAKRWGNREFDAAKFKAGNLAVRSSMAASILKNELKFKGKSILDIKAQFGSFDGFYFSDAFPTYLIQVGKKHSEETWQIVFLLDNDRRVRNVIIHKNCCE